MISFVDAQSVGRAAAAASDRARCRFSRSSRRPSPAGTHKS